MRNMGEASDVPIEPPAQSALLDACSALPGVLGAGVPGGASYLITSTFLADRLQGTDDRPLVCSRRVRRRLGPRALARPARRPAGRGGGAGPERLDRDVGPAAEQVGLGCGWEGGGREGVAEGKVGGGGGVEGGSGGVAVSGARGWLLQQDLDYHCFEDKLLASGQFQAEWVKFGRARANAWVGRGD